MLVAFAPIVQFLVTGASNFEVPFDVLVYSVLIFVVIPLAAGSISRLVLIRRKGEEWFTNRFRPAFHPWPAPRPIEVPAMALGLPRVRIDPPLVPGPGRVRGPMSSTGSIVLRRSTGSVVLALALGAAAFTQADLQRVDGGIVRGPTDRRRIALVLTGHEFAEGATSILDDLAARRVKASFFLTGAFLRNPEFAPTVRRMATDGHYLGPHSDAHLLYCPWTGPKLTLVSRQQFADDMAKNLDALAAFGVKRDEARYFLPPYEWYNAEIVEWSRALGLTLINYTPGTRSNADYTGEGTRQFVDSTTIYESILRREGEGPDGLNGFLLLLHVGAGPGRADKFHRRFGRLLDVLSARGYTFVRVNELL